MNIALWVTDRVWRLVEIKIMKFHRCKLQYNQINQTCNHNQDSIEICSAQQVRADRELLYTESWYFEMHAEFTWAAILNLLLHADHILQCADHNIMMCHVRAVCLSFRAVS